MPAQTGGCPLTARLSRAGDRRAFHKTQGVAGSSLFVMNVKPITVLFCVLALVAVAAVAGWVAGSRIESPAEAAARTAPPTPSPILVPVEERVLSSNS